MLNLVVRKVTARLWKVKHDETEFLWSDFIYSKAVFQSRGLVTCPIVCVLFFILLLSNFENSKYKIIGTKNGEEQEWKY
jgi:hypothetical protein